MNHAIIDGVPYINDKPAKRSNNSELLLLMGGALAPWLCPECGAHLAGESLVCLNLCHMNVATARRFNAMLGEATRREEERERQEYTDVFGVAPAGNLYNPINFDDLGTVLVRSLRERFPEADFHAIFDNWAGSPVTKITNSTPGGIVITIDGTLVSCLAWNPVITSYECIKQIDLIRPDSWDCLFETIQRFLREQND